MLRLLGFFIIAAALMFGATWLFDNDNPLEIRWFDGEIYDWSLAWLIVTGIVFAIASIVIYELARLILGQPTRWWRKRKTNRQLKGLQTVTRGMMAVAAGDSTQARELKREAEKLLGEREPATLLLSAQAAELDDNHEVAQLKYRQMMRQGPTRLLGLRGLLHDAVATGDQDQALDLARQAFKDHPYTEWVVVTLFEQLVQHRLWAEAYRRVDDLRLNKLIDQDEAQRRRGVLKHLVAHERAAAGEAEEALKSAQDATKRQRSFAPAAVFAAELAQKLQRPGLARTVLEESWARGPHPLVAETYIALEPNETPRVRLARLERLVKRNGSHHLTQRVMIEASLAAGENDRALTFAKQVPGANPTVGTLQAAIAAFRAGEPTSSRIAELEALAADAPADEAWVCQRTGHAFATWAPFGPTGEFDTLRWQSPPKVATLVMAPVRNDDGFTGPTVDLDLAPETKTTA